MTGQAAPNTDKNSTFAAARVAFFAVLVVVASPMLRAQATPPGTTSAPATDSAPLGPTTPPPAAPVTDAAAEASPVMPAVHGGHIPADTAFSIRVHQTVDSGHLKNGEMIKASLAAPIMLSKGAKIPAGTHVGLSVLTVNAAGHLHSRGEITLQVVEVGSVSCFSDAVTIRGDLGHKDLADSAPEKGTEARLASGSTLHFVIPPTPKQ